MRSDYRHYQLAETALAAAAAKQGENLEYTATEALLDALAHAVLDLATATREQTERLVDFMGNEGVRTVDMT